MICLYDVIENVIHELKRSVFFSTTSNAVFREKAQKCCRKDVDGGSRGRIGSNTSKNEKGKRERR